MQVVLLYLKVLEVVVNVYFSKLWYRGGNSTTAEEVSRFQRLFPNRVGWCEEGHPTTENLLLHSHGLTTTLTLLLPAYHCRQWKS